MTDAAIPKKMFGSGHPPILALHLLSLVSRMTALIISDEGMNDIMKIVMSLEESCLLIKGVSETLKNKTKERKGIFLSMLLGKFGASLLENLLTVKDTIIAGESTIIAEHDF